MAYTLHVRAIEAKEIAKMDTFGKSDPFLKIILGESPKQKTKVKKNTMTPVWNEEFKFQILDMNDTLHITMKDKDVLKDDEMAKVDICLNTLKKREVVDKWYDMKPVKGVKKGGKLHLMLHIATNEDKPFVQTVIQQPAMQPQMGMQPGMCPQGMQPQMGMQSGMYQQPM